MKSLSIIIILLFSCKATSIFETEGFYIDQEKVYHYSMYGDTTLINHRDAIILKNDSLIQFYQMKSTKYKL